MFQRKYSRFLRGAHTAKVQPLAKDETTNSQYSRNSTLTKSKYALKLSLWNSSSSFTSGQVDNLALSHFKRKRRAARWREIITKIVAMNAVLSFLVTLMGYYSLTEFNAEFDRPGSVNIWLKGGICTLSIVQLSLLILYHSYARRYLTTLNTALRSGGRHSALLRVRSSLLQCLLECVLHLIVLIPDEQSYTITVFDRRSNLTLNDCLYLGLLIRNYDTIRCAYWLGNIPTFRFAFVTRLSRTRSSFLWRYSLHEYEGTVVVALCCASVCLLGLVEYTVRKGEADGSLRNLWEVISAVAMTQATVGYGRDAPKSPLSQLAVAVSISFGLGLFSLATVLVRHRSQLSPPQSLLYASILHTGDCAEYESSAVRLIQLWWKRILLRRKRLIHVPTGVAFSRQLEDFAGLQWVKTSQNSPSISTKLDAFQAEMGVRLKKLSGKVGNTRGIREAVSVM